jgi:hypothetical protein
MMRGFTLAEEASRDTPTAHVIVPPFRYHDGENLGHMYTSEVLKLDSDGGVLVDRDVVQKQNAGLEDGEVVAALIRLVTAP